jgi:hypothetical protein
MYEVVLKLEDGKSDRIVIKSNVLQNAITKITSNVWVKCDESDRYFNMNKVINFYVTKLD